MAENEIREGLRKYFKRLDETERDKSDMYHEVGKAIVNLSVIEEYMAGIFVTLSGPMKEAEAATLFYESQNIAHKIKLVGYALMRSGWTKGASEWPSLSAKIGKQKFVRNMAAHASLGFTQTKEAKGWKVMLTNQELDRKHKRTELEITDMKTAADELDELRRVMQKFLIRALRHVGPQA